MQAELEACQGAVRQEVEMCKSSLIGKISELRKEKNLLNHIQVIKEDHNNSARISNFDHGNSARISNFGSVGSLNSTLLDTKELIPPAPTIAAPPGPTGIKVAKRYLPYIFT